LKRVVRTNWRRGPCSLQASPGSSRANRTTSHPPRPGTRSERTFPACRSTPSPRPESCFAAPCRLGDGSLSEPMARILFSKERVLAGFTILHAASSCPRTLGFVRDEGWQSAPPFPFPPNARSGEGARWRDPPKNPCTQRRNDKAASPNHRPLPRPSCAPPPAASRASMRSSRVDFQRMKFISSRERADQGKPL